MMSNVKMVVAHFRERPTFNHRHLMETTLLTCLLYRVTTINMSRKWIEWAEWAASLCTAKSPFPGHVYCRHPVCFQWCCYLTYSRRTFPPLGVPGASENESLRESPELSGAPGRNSTTSSSMLALSLVVVSLVSLLCLILFSNSWISGKLKKSR